MSLKNGRTEGDLEKAFSNLRLLSFLFIFFIFAISGSTVLVVATQTRENVISLAKDEIRSKASMAALVIDVDALASLQPGDENSPAFLRVRDQLAQVRRSDAKIRYIYTMRKTGDGVSFIVDADYGIAPDAAPIGQSYEEATPDLLAGFSAPSSDKDFTTDQWGSFLSGYAPVRDSSGRIVGIIGLDMDESAVAARVSYLNGIFFFVGILATLAAVVGLIVIERRRSIDEALIVSNRNYLTQVFGSVQAGIVIVDARTHRIVDANPAALTLIGAEKDQVVGSVCHRFICPDEEGDCPLSDRGKDRDHSERSLVTADGRRIPIIKYVIPVTLEGTLRYLETFIDITDRKKAEEDLVAAVRKLKVLSVVTRNDIISDIYALAGYLELIKDEVAGMRGHPLTEKIDWVMDRIRLKSAFFKDYDDAGTKEPVWQDINALVNIASDRLGPKKLPVTADCPGLDVYADPLLYKVFSSLFDNTLRHGAHATAVRVSCRRDGRSLTIVYEDDGRGIPFGEKERIFERGVGASTGLGLFLAREILGNTGLTIRENGIPGTGARFEISVPEGKFRIRQNSDGLDTR